MWVLRDNVTESGTLLMLFYPGMTISKYGERQREIKTQFGAAARRPRQKD